MVFDLCVNYYDDAVGSFDQYGPDAQRRDECLRMTELADLVTCASQNIADRASDFHPWVEYLPDSFDGRHFNRMKDPKDFYRKELRAGFCGLGKKALEIRPIIPTLVRNDVHLTVISDEAPSLGMPYEFLRWRYAEFPSQLTRVDFCVAYRTLDSAYNRGHSFFKIGVFMVEGVPPIASPVPAYRELLHNGRGGTLCSTDADWDNAIRSVLDDREKLARWSHEATVQTAPFATNVIAQQYRNVFDRLTKCP